MRGCIVAGLLLVAACADKANEPAPPAEDQEPVEVGRWSGSENTDTEDFTVDGAWELHWKVSGDGLLDVQWNDEVGAAVPVGQQSIETAAGSALNRDGGTYFLEIAPYGVDDYEVWVVDVPG